MRARDSIPPAYHRWWNSVLNYLWLVMEESQYFRPLLNSLSYRLLRDSENLGRKKKKIMLLYHLNSVQHELDVINRSQKPASKRSSSQTGEKYTHLWGNFSEMKSFFNNADFFFWHSAVRKVSVILKCITYSYSCIEVSWPKKETMQTSSGTAVALIQTREERWRCGALHSQTVVITEEEKREYSAPHPVSGQGTLGTVCHSPMHPPVGKK